MNPEVSRAECPFLRGPPISRNLRLSSFLIVIFVQCLLLGCTYTPSAAAPIPVPPAHPQTPSVTRFNLERNELDVPRLLLLHDFPLDNLEGIESHNEALSKARKDYADLFTYFEQTEKFSVVPLSLSSPFNLFAFGENIFDAIVIIAQGSTQQDLPAESEVAILEWLDSAGEESQGYTHHSYNQQQQQQQQQQQVEKENGEDAEQQEEQQQQQQQQQQYYSPLEKSRSLLLLIGPAASPSLLNLAGAVFGKAALTPSFLQQQAADLFQAVSLSMHQEQQQQQHQQEKEGSVFVARDLLEGHPHVVTQLAEDEVLVYRGGYHEGGFLVGCGLRGCLREPQPIQAFPLLLAPPTAFALGSGVNRSSSSSSSNSNNTRMALASALQTRNNSRVVLLSGPATCSTQFTSVPFVSFAGYEYRVANKRFCLEAAAWALNRRGALRWSNVRHHKVGAVENSRLYTLGEDLHFSVDIHELKDAVWQPFEANDVQIEYSLVDPFLRLFLSRQTESPTFSASFKAPDRHGVFKFVLRYSRLGYTSLFFHSLAPLRTPRTDESERLHPSGAFYYFVSILVLIGTVVFALLFIYSEEPVLSKLESKKTN